MFFIRSSFAFLLLREIPPHVAEVDTDVSDSLLSVFPEVFLFVTSLQVPELGLLTGSRALKAAPSSGGVAENK